MHVTGRHTDDTLSCAAYPHGIPHAIITGGFDHTHPFPGDNGLRFAWRDDVPEEERQKWEEELEWYGENGWRLSPAAYDRLHKPSWLRRLLQR
jgi:hypothetical protein